MRVKSGNLIVWLLSKVKLLTAAIIASFADAFKYGVTKKGIEARTAAAKRDKVYCRTNSMAAVKWTSRKNLGYALKESGKFGMTERGQPRSNTIFRGG